MRRAILAPLILAAAVVTYHLATAPPAHCNWCVATFCGSSSQCPSGCFCAIPFGDIVGTCSGTN